MAREDWSDGAPPGFENVSGAFPEEITLDEDSREAIVEHRSSMSEGERSDVDATIEELFDLLGRAHALSVLHEFATSPEPLRFGDLRNELSVSPNTLSARLDEFVQAGLLERTEYDEVPPRVEYEPTDRAEALFPIFGYVLFWAESNDLA